MNGTNKKVIIILGISVFFAFSLNFAFAQCSAGTSCSETNFEITANVCIIANSCVSNGNVYCDSNLNILNTSLSQIACKGTGSGGADCCPLGFNCTASGCRRSSITVSSLCTQYKTQSECNADRNGAGSSGQGEGCNARWTGVNLWQVPDSCRCSWQSGNCTFIYNVTDLVPSGEPRFYECVKTYTLGSCDVNNKQILSWTVQTSNNSRPPGFPNSTTLEDTNCIDGSKILDCGERAIKVPGFSSFNFILVLLILTIIYGFAIKGKK
jgi:hypothetical protein